MTSSFDKRVEALERWKAAQATQPTIFDVIRSGDIELFGTYIEVCFREAAAQAIKETERAERIRNRALAVFDDADTAEAFLRSPHPQLQGRTPLAVAVASEDGVLAALALCTGDSAT